MRVQSVSFDQGFRHGRVKNLSLGRRAIINNPFCSKLSWNSSARWIIDHPYAINELVLILGLVASKLGDEIYNQLK